MQRQFSGRPRVRAGRSVNIRDWQKQGEVLSSWNNGKFPRVSTANIQTHNSKLIHEKNWHHYQIGNISCGPVSSSLLRYRLDEEP